MTLEAKENDLSNRIIYMDLLRIAACFGIIIIHVNSGRWYVTPVTSVNWQFMNIYASIARWASPVFFMLSGVFSLRPNKEDITFKQEMRITIRKTCKMIGVVIFWGLLYNIISAVRRNSFDISDIVMPVILGYGWYHLWFLYSLIGLYLLTPVFRSLIANSKKEYMEYFLILYFVIGACIPLINLLLRCFPDLVGSRRIYLPVPELTGYIGYYIAGYYFANYKIGKKLRNTIYILSVFSLLLTIIGTSAASIYSEEPVSLLYTRTLANHMLVAFGIFLLFQDIYEKKRFSERTERIILKLSKSTFGIYLVHALVIDNLTRMGINTLIITPLLSVPLIAIAVMVISFIIILVVKKIPVINRYVL